MPSISYFGIVHDVVAEEVERLAVQTGRSRVAVCADIKAEAARIQEDYRNCRSPHLNSSVACLAYVYSYLAVNADILEQAITLSPAICEHIDWAQGELREVPVCVIGGGPGTEVLAFVKFAERGLLDAPPQYSFYSLDSGDEWRSLRAKIITKAKKVLRSRYAIPRTRPVDFRSRYKRIDLSQEPECCIGQAGCPRQIYTVCYVISDACAVDAGTLDGFFTEGLARCAPAGSRIIILDRNESQWVEQASRLAAAAGFTLRKVHERQEGRMSTDEDTDSLGDLIDRIGWHPRLKSNVFWVSGVKG